MERYLERHEEKQRMKLGLDPADSKATTNPWSKQDVRPGFTPASQVAIGSSQGHVTTSQYVEKQVGAGQMLLLLLRLRQCCSHLNLLKGVSFVVYSTFLRTECWTIRPCFC